MKIEYSFYDLVDKHYSSGNILRSDIGHLINDMSYRYDVTKRTVKNWMKKDKVPEKYIKMGCNVI